MYEDLRGVVDADFDRARRELEELVRIPSVSAPDFDAAEVRRSAEASADILRSSGVAGVRLLEVDGAHPAVYGEVPGPDDAPTVLLYAHHDVQPPGPEDQWDSPPFEPTERNGRLFGRGTSDDKAGVVVHAAVIRALANQPSVNIKLFLEGEEEVGSPNVDAFIDEYRDLLAADVIVIADSTNWTPGIPALTTSLRGLVDCVVEVRTLDSAVHSGEFGGVFPDSIIVLARIIASLHDDDGHVAVPGLVSGEAIDPGMTERDLRNQTGAVEGLELIGSGSLTSRLWRQPSISVLAIDAPSIGEAINQIVPTARAKVSMRIPPGQDPAEAQAALVDHLEAAVPWGAAVTITPGALADPIEVDTTGPVPQRFAKALSEAYGEDVVEIGVGGTIPIVAAIHKAHAGAVFVLNGVADRTSQPHGPNESLSLADLRSGILAEAMALRSLSTSA